MVHNEEFAKRLEELGFEVHRGIGKTGIVANLKAGSSEKAIGLRADMDCICTTELGEHPYSSKTPGRMHACGHDGHTISLLGAAELLAENPDFDGTVRLVFQPAEEPGKGALAMMEDGFFERFPVDEMYGLHNLPMLPENTFHTRVGGTMASEDNFTIKIMGRGGHASAPNHTIDPLIPAAQIILALQTIVSRNEDPVNPSVVSCTELFTDGVHNTIPSTVTILGDTRSTTPEAQKIIEERMEALCKNICKAYNAECEFTYTHEFVPLVNDARCTARAIEAAKKVVGEENVNGNGQPAMASEDFARFLEKVPGCYVTLGGGRAEDQVVYSCHNPHFDYNDDILETGAWFFYEVTRTCLPKA